MVSTKVHVRVRVSQPYAEKNSNQPPRDAFWEQVRSDYDQVIIRESNVQKLEGRFLREVPRELARLLVNSVAAPITNAAKLFEETEGRYLWRELKHRFMMNRDNERTFSPSDYSGILVQLEELRANRLRDIPKFQQTMDQLRAASRVYIHANILGYSSLEFGLTFGNLEALAKAFDSDFESFQVFLNVFIPRAFENTFSGSSGRGYEWSIQAERSIEDAFDNAAKASEALPAQSISSISTTLSEQGLTSPSAQKAEWLWRLANGSLLVPCCHSIGSPFLHHPRGRKNSLNAG